MSADRDQAPGKARLKLARDQGHAAYSPELASAVGWLTALAALCALAPGLGDDVVAIMKLSITLAGPAQPEDAAAWCARLALALAGRLLAITASYAAGAAVAHLIQTRGLVVQHRLAPDLSRLRPFRSGGGSMFERVARPAWSAVRGLIVMAVVGSWMNTSWPAFAALESLKAGPMASASAALAARLAATLAATALALGAADYAFRRRAFLNRLKTTTQEQREERRRVEGDPAALGARRHLARSRQVAPVERA